MIDPANLHNIRLAHQQNQVLDELTVTSVQVDFRSDDGEWSRAPARQFLDVQPKIAVLPYDPYVNAVALIENLHIGMIKQAGGPWQLELPYHPIIPNQPHELAAQKALFGNVDAEGLDFEFIGDFYTTPHFSNEKIYLYCAGIDSNEMQKQSQQVLLPLQEVEDALLGNYFQNSTIILSLYWLIANADRLQKKWR